MIAAPVSWRSTARGLMAWPTSATFTSFVTLMRPVSTSTAISAPAPPSIQNGVMSDDCPVSGSAFLYGGANEPTPMMLPACIAKRASMISRSVMRVPARPTDPRRGTRARSVPRSNAPAAIRSSCARTSSAAIAHGVAHVERRPRAERAHVVRRRAGVGVHHAHGLGCDPENLGRDLRHRCIGALTHVHRAAMHRATPVAIHLHHRDGGRRRDAGLQAERHPAPAPDGSGSTIERPVPLHPLGQQVEDARRFPRWT